MGQDRVEPALEAFREVADGHPDEVDVFHLCHKLEQETAIQLKWLRTRMKQAAPQALVVAD